MLSFLSLFLYAVIHIFKKKKKVVYTPDAFAGEPVSDHVIYIGPSDSVLDLIAPLRFRNNPSHPPVILCVDVEELAEVLISFHLFSYSFHCSYFVGLC